MSRSWRVKRSDLHLTHTPLAFTSCCNGPIGPGRLLPLVNFHTVPMHACCVSVLEEVLPVSVMLWWICEPKQKLIMFSSLLFCQFKEFMASWVRAKLFSMFSWNPMKKFCMFTVLSFWLNNDFRLWPMQWGRCLEVLAPTSQDLCFDVLSTSASFKRRTYLV